MQSNCQVAFKGSAEARKHDFMRTVSAVDGSSPATCHCVGCRQCASKVGVT